MPSARAKYRIQTVAEMTGVSAATLRAWERRYGFPVPERTSSAYRLYSDRDIQRINRLRELCDGGMAPAQAAKQVLHEDQAAAAAPAPGETSDAFATATERILTAVGDFDPGALEDAVRSAMFLGSPDTIFDKVLGPALAAIGTGWENGQFSVAQEHFASEVLGNALRDTLRLVQPKNRDRLAVLACFADEQHGLPLYGLAFRLASWGIHSVVLGARTPPFAIRHAREALHPQLIGLSATLTPPPHRVRELLDDYSAACAKTPWIVGGIGAPEMQDAIEQAGGFVDDPAAPHEVRRRLEAAMARA